jgi:putative addiction module CopG family antidote
MPSKSSLNVSLTPELTAFIAAKINSGRYRSASEVVRAALRLLDDHDQRKEHLTEMPAESGSNAR